MIRSLRDVPGFIENAFVVATPRFQPENIVLGHYTFLPWVRSGIGAFAQAAGPDLRATVPVKLTVGDGVASEDIPQTLELYGPGDVIGLNADQIVRRLPAPNAVGVEGNYLAHIEFDRPDLPWLFSPFVANGERLTPWLALVVIDASAVRDRRPGRDGRPPTLTTTLGQLQSLDDSWAWAHAQLAGAPEDGDIGDRLGPSHAAVNLSRIVCPRSLNPDGADDAGREWLACLVPAIDAGRRTALGLGGGDLGPAWRRDPNGADANDAIELPIYDAWSFRTGPAGDFESLAELLVAVPAPYQVGRRVIDASQPQGPDHDPLDPAEVGRRQVIRGPLVSPLTDRPPDVPEDDVTWDADRTALLGKRLDDADRIANEPGGVTADLRPLVGPEIYGRYHLARSRVNDEVPNPDATWFGQLNLRPVNRVVAGLGTRVVQRDQEPLMQSAWAQVGQVEVANQWVRAAQLSRFAAVAVHRKLRVLPEGDLLSVTRRAQSRIGIGPAGETVAARIAVSATPTMAVAPAFRRTTRARGPMARFDATGIATAGLRSLVVEAGGPRDFARPYVELDGITGLSEAAIGILDPEIVARVYDVDPGDAIQRVRDQSTILAQPAAPDVLTPDAIGAMALDPGFRLADAATTQVLSVMPDAAAAGAQFGPALAASHLGLLQGLKSLSATASPEVVAKVDASIGALSATLSSSAALSAATASAAEVATASEAHLEAATTERTAGEIARLSGVAVAILAATERETRLAVTTSARTVSTNQAMVESAMAFEEAVASRPAVEVATSFANSPLVARFAASTVFAAGAPQLVAPPHAFPAHLVALMADVAAIAPAPPGRLVVHHPIDPGAAVGGLHVDPNVVVHHGPGHVVEIDPHAPIGVVLGGGHGPVVVGPHGGGHVEPAAPTPPVVVLTPAATRLQTVMSAATLVTADAFKQSLASTIDGFVNVAWPTTPVRDRLAVTAANILEPLRPGLTITARIDSALLKPAWLPADWFADELIQPIMAAPVFTRAMYEALDNYNRDWLVPGLGRMKQPDLVTALVTNARFIEALLIGLSHEMGRELLWRGYPTDQRGTYFRRFFDGSTDEMQVDGQPGLIHTFDATPLGRHLVPTLDGRIVFLIRGELIRRYPDAVVTIVQQDGTEPTGHPVFTRSQARPLFLAPLEPNIVLAGFDLTTDEVEQQEAAGHPFWLVIAEHPTGPRFGLDLNPDLHELTRAELAWGDLPLGPSHDFLQAGTEKAIPDDGTTVTWGRDGATNAHILLQDPVRAAFPVAKLLREMDENHDG